jgi:SAM-dependent methyltransferase
MRLNSIERAFVNNPVRAARQHHREAAWFERLVGGDVCDIELTSGGVDSVVDFGIIHHVPDWQESIGEIARVLRPGGLLLFEEIPATCWRRGYFARSPSIRAKTVSMQKSSPPNWPARGCTAPARSSGTSGCTVRRGGPQIVS